MGAYDHARYDDAEPTDIDDDMNNSSDENNRLIARIHDLRHRFDESREALSKELADALADADRDFGYFRSGERYNEVELKDISERMRLRATRFEAEHPKLGAVFREFAELLRGMGV